LFSRVLAVFASASLSATLIALLTVLLITWQALIQARLDGYQTLPHKNCGRAEILACKIDVVWQVLVSKMN
jgi:hypothetical protein